MFFFEKKNQKTFASAGAGSQNKHPTGIKSFLVLFFKKERPSLLDPDAPARRSLARHRAVATGLLILMAALTVGSYFLPPGYWTSLLQSGAKAGFVGGIADWFAVTALFRHPLGLPIPHTAIIPNEKIRLGQALGRFFARHVVTEEEVSRLLGRIDLSDIVRAIFTTDEVVQPLARTLAGYMPRVLRTIEDGRARRVLGRVLPRMIGGAEAGRILARTLRGLVEGGRHQELFGFILTKLRIGMLEKEDQLRGMIEDRVRAEGGRLVGWALGASIATRVLATVNAEMDKMDPDGSEVREAFDHWVRREIQLLEEDPARAAEFGRAIRRVVGHETVQTWSWEMWGRLRRALEEDAAKPDGHTVTLLEGSVRNLGDMLASDPVARARLQRTVEHGVAKLLPAAQTQIAGFIADVVGGWDTATLVDRIELRVGRDLQYVRMNGTLVGFVVGAAVFALLEAVFKGRVLF
jgi:uncharacterized membrane-anchored protein YjiN (DUF445 family)